MQEAVNHIENLEKKIGGLGIKRDEHKNLFNLRVVCSNRKSLNNCLPTCEVMVRSCLIGVEVVINNGFEEQFLFLLLRMMQVLLKGLKLISCVSTKVNQSVLIVNEVISYLKKNKLQGYLFKLDFHKAFDSVLWEYIDEVMLCMGFRNK
jgi:hypothetical protein